MQTPDSSGASDGKWQNTSCAGRVTAAQRASGLGRHFDDRTSGLAEASHHAVSRAALFGAFAAGVANALSAELVQLLEYLPGEGRFVLRAGRGFPEDARDRTRVPAGLLSQAGRALLDPMGRPVELQDFSRPHEWADDELVSAHGARSGVVVKVKAGARDFGALGVFCRTPRPFSPEEVRFLLRAAALLGAGVERLDQEKAAIAWRSRAELLRTGAALLKVPAERDELLSAAVLAAVSGGVGGSRPIADWCFADALEANGARPKIARVAVDHAEGASSHIEQAFSVPLAPSASHGAPKAYATRQPELVGHTDAAFRSKIARDPAHHRALEEARPYSYMCVPVIGRERYYGSMSFLRVEDGTPIAYDEADVATCAEFASLVGAAIDAGQPRPDMEEARDAMRTHSGPAEIALSEPSDRERSVLELIAKGLNKNQISSTLCIAYSTVRTHRQHLCQKLGLPSNSSDITIITQAQRCGWLQS